MITIHRLCPKQEVGSSEGQISRVLTSQQRRLSKSEDPSDGSTNVFFLCPKLKDRLHGSFHGCLEVMVQLCPTSKHDVKQFCSLPEMDLEAVLARGPGQTLWSPVLPSGYFEPASSSSTIKVVAGLSSDRWTGTSDFWVCRENKTKKKNSLTLKFSVDY